MPGLHIVQHGSQGKGYQFYLRGFDAVHGADIETLLEDIPVNEASNVHAHGYLDLAFIIPEVVERVDAMVGIEGRAIAQRQDFTGRRVHDDDAGTHRIPGCHEVVHLFLNHGLNRRVEGQHHGVATRDTRVGVAVDQQFLAVGKRRRAAGFAPAKVLFKTVLNAEVAHALAVEPTEDMGSEMSPGIDPLTGRL
ncbi:MAG: hypothetical protein ACPG77_12875 [Nannocystaceae bacterium]